MQPWSFPKEVPPKQPGKFLFSPVMFGSCLLLRLGSLFSCFPALLDHVMSFCCCVELLDISIGAIHTK